MTAIALAFCALIVALGALGLASPSRIVRVARRFQTTPGLYVAAGIRLAMGVALFLAAPVSRAPEALRILGLVIVVAGLATLLLGRERLRRLLFWWSGKGPALVRAQGAFAVVLGLLLAYALLP